MKAKPLLISLFLLLTASTSRADVEINATNFPDANFRNYVLYYLQDNNSQYVGGDGILTYWEIGNITAIDVNYEYIESLKGIEYFTALRWLYCNNNLLTTLDVSKNIKLEFLECNGNYLTTLDMSKNTALTELSCTDNRLTTLDVSKNTVLTRLSCGNNKLKMLDVSKNTELSVLSCYNNRLTALDVSKNIELEFLICSGNQLTTINVSGCIELDKLDCSGNQLMTINVSGCTALLELYCYQNQIKGAGMDALVESLPKVYRRDMYVIYNEDEQNVMTVAQVASAKAKGWIPKYYNGSKWQDYAGSEPASERIDVNATNFPDANFRNWVLSQSYGTDGVLTDEEIAGVTSINVVSKNIQSLKGIEYFTALKILYCDNNQLTELDLSENTELVYLNCYNNKLTSLDLSNNTKLIRVGCYQNQIKGAAMDAFVESLPTVTEGDLKVIHDEDEQNEMTTTQVAAAKAKGWIPRYFKNGTGWEEYSGSEPVTEGIAINATNIPDANFRTWMLEQEYGKDGVLTEEEIAGVTSINVVSKNIQSLKGIEYFTALKILYCDNNQLTTLNASGCAALIFLSCYENQLTALDVSKNTALTTLNCWGNQLTTLDVSQNTELKWLSCSSNQLATLDVSKNTKLTYLRCFDNQLTTLDASGCSALPELECSSNQLVTLNVSGCTKLTKLSCYKNQIKGAGMDALVESLPTVNSGTMQVIYNENEQNVMTITQVAEAKAKGWIPQYSSGSKWQEYAGYNPDSKDVIINEENFPDANFRKWLLSQSYGKDGVLTEEEIAEVKSISIKTKYNESLQSLKGIEYFTALESLDCDWNKLTTLDVSQNTKLTELNCSNNQLTTLDVSQNTELDWMNCSTNQLTMLDVSKNTKLTQLSCSGNQLSSLDVSNNIVLDSLNCGSNQLTSLDVSKNAALTYLQCTYNKLTTLDVSGCTALRELQCDINQLTTLDVSKNTALEMLRCYSNQLTTLDVSKNIALKMLRCVENQLSSLDVSGCTELTDLDCSSNQLTALDVSGCTALYDLDCYENQLSALDVSKNTALKKLYCYKNQLTTLNLSGYTALEMLRCDENQLSSLDVSGCTELTDLDCSSNQLTTLDVSKNTTLRRLYCFMNQLTSLDVSKNTALRVLSCYNNQLTELDVSKNTALYKLYCYQNQIKSAAMDALINSLPSKSEEQMYVIYNEDEQNEMTTDQATAAKAKGWTPQYYDGSKWKEYVSKEEFEDGILSIDNGKLTMDNCYDLNGRPVGKEKLKPGIYIVNGKKVMVK
ncbi:MAG: hypothetical protein J6W52_07540 [Bacteroidaceae bacterium]|nr:hypothetical protein [Bacteroidaceae bacterium]